MIIKSTILRSLLVIMLAMSQQSLAQVMKWDLNDVSYLFQLPDGDAQADIDLLGPEDHGVLGALLPREIYQQVPTLLIAGNGNSTLYENALRVVAARIDPCPSLESNDCVPEIRLVWQPVEHDGRTGKWLAGDAAVHSFYRLSHNDFELLKEELWRIKQWLASQGVTTTSTALDIHPALKNRNTADTFNHEIQQTLIKYAGSSNLEKITYVALMTPKRWWRFGIFEKNADGAWSTSDIPRLDMTTEDIFNTAVEDGVGLGLEKGVDAVFNIFPEEYPDTDNIFKVINKGYRFNDDRDKTVFKEKLAAIDRFRNPHNTNPDNLDCASCHYADATREYIGNRFPELEKVSTVAEFVNPAPGVFNLENLSLAAKSGRNVRAFGYFKDKPVIIQRTINDAAVSANWMNTNTLVGQATIAEGLHHL